MTYGLDINNYKKNTAETDSSVFFFPPTTSIEMYTIHSKFWHQFCAATTVSFDVTVKFSNLSRFRANFLHYKICAPFRAECDFLCFIYWVKSWMEAAMSVDVCGVAVGKHDDNRLWLMSFCLIWPFDTQSAENIVISCIVWAISFFLLHNSFVLNLTRWQKVEKSRINSFTFHVVCWKMVDGNKSIQLVKSLIGKYLMKEE